MHRVIPQLIPDSLAGALCQALTGAPFRTGDATAGKSNRPLKNNLELSDLTAVPGELVTEVIRTVRGNPLLQAFAMPRRSTALLFNRFDVGMYYGDHVDSPTNSVDKQLVRSDLSMTVFLSAPETYDGGELVIDSDGDATAIKLPAGHAVVYATGVVHRVNAVARGTRLAFVTWLESAIADHGERQIVFDLTRAREALGVDGPREPRQLIDKCIVNLTRKWMG